ncbi:CpXC domain-containing protein [Falsiroseomonas sp. HW251]|uniref:CpXC domain-containing protein n=1 Tax=Falsiroseomonas sp. HW251 TaxID=3390998 RepID=UPI003D3143AD
MAVFHPHVVRCACGTPVNVLLADSVNVDRAPQIRDQVLSGELHRTACVACGTKLTIEKPFYYTDLGRRALFKILPHGERHRWKADSKELDRAASFMPEAIVATRSLSLRVLYGLDELREKLVAQDHGLDDREVELLKVLLVADHPVLLRRARLRLTLMAVDDTELHFRAAYEHSPGQFALGLPRRIAEPLMTKDASLHAGGVDAVPKAARGPGASALRAWSRKAHGTADVFGASDHWVNLWRWSPQPSALDLLRRYSISATADETIDTNSTEFMAMLQGLPRGQHLPSWAKQDVKVLFDYAQAHNDQRLEDNLFELRFGFALEDDWTVAAAPQDLATLWTLLKDLPDSNVEGNTRIQEIRLDVGADGGLYDPTASIISIGSAELQTRERFEDVVRHEVGHAVHEQNKARVNPWLASKFGWQTFERTNAGVDAWVSLMGGWGNMPMSQRAEVRAALGLALGSGQRWEPAGTPSLPSGHPWNGPEFGPRLAYQKTGAYWYQNVRTWYRFGGKAFFLNYWYATLIAVDTDTLDLIERMPSNYAAMSHFEFFAELYALYYDLDDPQRGAIPNDVAQWFDSEIGAPQIGAPMPAPLRPPEPHETIVRPRRRKPGRQ